VAVGIATNPIVITETGTNVLMAGGPLNGSILIQSSPGQARMDYQLTNASGILFHLVHQDEKVPPRVEIRQGDKLLAQGAFEFG
jgi:hypothetical protein